MPSRISLPKLCRLDAGRGDADALERYQERDIAQRIAEEGRFNVPPDNAGTCEHRTDEAGDVEDDRVDGDRFREVFLRHH
jgi:hypothetical protein